MMLLQGLCRLSFARHSLYVDWLHYLLWELWNHGNWMWWLFGWCRGSWATIIIHNGFGCSGTFYCNWDILQRFGGYHGRSADMATSLSHTCKKDVNKGMSGFLYLLLCLWCIYMSCKSVLQFSWKVMLITNQYLQLAF